MRIGGFGSAIALDRQGGASPAESARGPLRAMTALLLLLMELMETLRSRSNRARFAPT
jgi:hypothetical protein